MLGLMQDAPLTLQMVRERVADLYPAKTVTTRLADGAVRRATYGEMLARTGRLANALRALGIARGDRIATLAWNGQAHLELYLAVPCMGAVLHTINARLPGAAVSRRLALGGDRMLFVDRSLLAMLRGIDLPATLERIVVLDDGTAVEADAGRPVVDHEAMIAAVPADVAWPDLDERAAAGLCFTSGTTGEPKGVLYSHRSTVLHTMACLFADGIAMRERDVCMPVVPMFHANGWGFPHAALMAGASLALPHRQLDPMALVDLIETAGVTMATAVPTVWLNVLAALRDGTIARERIASLRRIPMGGAAVSRALIDGFADFDVEVTHCWGMTEISPLGLVNVPRSTLSPAEADAARAAQGLPIPGCTVRAVDAEGRTVPPGTPGELQVRGPWVADGYFDAAAADRRATAHADAFAVDEAGRRWLRTGDVATIDAHGYVRIVDRAKDLIKSGGEWISSLALEACLMAHPAVREAAVVARPHPVWQERPVAFVALDGAADGDALRAHLAASFATWQVPDTVVVLAELPKGLTGKVDKVALRAHPAVRGAPTAV